MIESYGATLNQLGDHFGNDRDLNSITSEEVLSFLNKITENGKQQTKHGLNLCRRLRLFSDSEKGVP